jgi:Protein of unknown function (DUF3726)
VSDLSLNEVESLALKVARGAGYSWGLAEDVARATRAMARHGLPWAEALAGLARDGGTWRAAPHENWRRGSETAPLCPVRLAARLIDDPSLLDEGPLQIENVGLPVWISAVFAASDLGDEFDVDWSGGDASTRVADVTISRRPTSRASEPLRRRAFADDRILAELGVVAARVYVPASEGSRVRGAGGGRVDDE